MDSNEKIRIAVERAADIFRKKPAAALNTKRASGRVEHGLVCHARQDDYTATMDMPEPIGGGGFIPLDSVYAYEPVPVQLEPQFVEHVLGAQGQLWTEYMKTPKQVEYMAFPRLIALAEVGWSRQASREWEAFRLRLASHGPRLSALGVNYYRSPQVPWLIK